MRVELAFEALDELGEQLGADLGDHAPSELGHLALDRDVAVDDDMGRDAGPVSRLGHRGGDDGVGAALATGVATLGLEDDLAVVDVLFEEDGRALVLRGDRADLHLDDAAVLVALDLLELRARAGTGR